MKFKVLVIATFSMLLTVLVATSNVQAQKYIDVIGNPPYGSDPVIGVLGSGATPNNSRGNVFANGTQQRINSISASLSVAGISGTQYVGGNTISVEPRAAATVITVINSPANSNSIARSDLVIALGGGDAAQQLARSMEGMINGDSSINPMVLNDTVNSYNSYMRSRFDSDQATQKPAYELDAYIQGLPPGQKAVQVILGKLLEGSN